MHLYLNVLADHGGLWLYMDAECMTDAKLALPYNSDFNTW